METPIKYLMANVMVYKIAALISCCSFLLVACGNTQSAEAAVRKNLRDPDSAKFGKVTIIDSGQKNLDGEAISKVCVTVNSKNAMGGYTGDQEALLLKIGDKWQFINIFNVSHDECIAMKSSG